MTAAVGLERLPRSIRAALDEAAGNVITTANQLDALVRGDGAALDAIALSEAAGDRITHDLTSTVGTSRRDGPHRATLIDLAQAIDDVVDAIEELACRWSRRPVLELAELVLALRDGARDVAHAVASLEQPDEFETWLARGRERDEEIRRLSRAGRTWLLVEQSDAQLAICGHALLERAEDLERACVRLRERLQAHALA